jgi:replicative DNA helicase
MDVQFGALAKAIIYKDLKALIEAGVKEEFFPDDQYRQVFRFLLHHFRQYGTAPDEAVVKRAYPTLTWVDDEQPMEYFIDQLRNRREKTMQLTALQTAAQILGNDDDPEQHVKIRQVLQEMLVKSALEVSGTRDVDFVSAYESIIERLGERRQNPSHLRGFPTGFKGIDMVTGGLQPEQFIVVTGVPKSGKSSFLLYMALHLHDQGKRPLFLGFEMSNQEQEDRLVSLISGVGLTKILNGSTNLHEHLSLARALRKRRDMPPFIFSSDISSGTTVESVRAKIQKYDPDVVYIDGVYMMESESSYERGSPQALTELSRATKRLAQSTKKPIVVTTQSLVAKAKGGLTLSSLGYTSAWGQDADVILGVERQENTNISKFHVIDSRSGPRVDTYIEWDWDTGMVAEIDPALYTMEARAQGKAEYGYDGA